MELSRHHQAHCSLAGFITLSEFEMLKVSDGKFYRVSVQRVGRSEGFANRFMQFVFSCIVILLFKFSHQEASAGLRDEPFYSQLTTSNTLKALKLSSRWHIIV